MTKDELAHSLHGMRYGDEIAGPLQRAAADAGLVILYGASDDLVELRGAIEDELSAGNHTQLLFTREGLFNDLACACECHYFKMAKNKALMQGQRVTARWCAGPICWTYETTIPHVTFDIVEDDEPWCRGIIFALADVERAAS